MTDVSINKIDVDDLFSWLDSYGYNELIIKVNSFLDVCHNINQFTDEGERTKVSAEAYRMMCDLRACVSVIGFVKSNID